MTLLLPLRVAFLAGTEIGISWLALIGFAGALAASAGHILFGWLSDPSGRRRPWIVIGLLLSSLLLLLTGRAADLPTLMTTIIAWRLALNMMIAPLAALAGDVVPDDRKGLLGGLMAFAPGGGALFGMLVTWPGLAEPDARLAMVAGLVLLCVSPVLLLGTEPLLPRAPPVTPALPIRPGTPPINPAAGDAKRMWLARLAVQIAEATLFAYHFFWFRRVDPGMTDNRVASLFAVTLLVSAPLALLAGRWSDRSGRPFAPLQVAALLAAAGLVVMAAANGLAVSILGFAVFTLAAAGFLSLHSAQTLRVLHRADRRGRDLGLFNLANTLPSLIMPWLTLGMMPYYGYSGLFLALALLCLLGALVLAPPARYRT